MWASRIQSLTNKARSLMTGRILKLFRNKGPNRLYCCQPFDDICCSSTRDDRFYWPMTEDIRWQRMVCLSLIYSDEPDSIFYEQQTEVLPNHPNPSLILVVRTSSSANVANPIIISPMLKYLLEDTDLVNSWIVCHSRANMEISTIIYMMYACIYINILYVHVCMHVCMYLFTW